MRENLLSQRMERDPSVAWAWVGERIVLVCVRDSVLDPDHVVSLAGPAASAWEKLGGSMAVAQIARQLAREYVCELQQVRADLEDLLRELSRRGYVRSPTRRTGKADNARGGT